MEGFILIKLLSEKEPDQIILLKIWALLTLLHVSMVRGQPRHLFHSVKLTDLNHYRSPGYPQKTTRELTVSWALASFTGQLEVTAVAVLTDVVKAKGSRTV